MSQPVMYLDKDDPAARAVLEALWEFQALTYEHIAAVAFSGDQRKAYDMLRRLYENGHITTYRTPANQRVGYAVLTTKGAREAGGPSASWAPPRRERVARLLAVNDLYLKLLAAGIPREAVERRWDALERLDLMPSYSRLAARVEGKNKTWLLYIREEGVRKALVKSMGAVSPQFAHAVFYEDSAVRDIKEFLKHSVPQDFHCLQMSDLPTAFKALALEPEALARRMAEHLSVRMPGKVIRLAQPSPFEYAWERSDGARMILADLSTNNLGAVAAAMGLNIDYAADPKQNWGQGVLIFASDEKAAKLWRSLIGHKEWLWLVRYDLPPGRSLFRSKELGWEPWGVS